LGGNGLRLRQRIDRAEIARAAFFDDQALAVGRWRCRLEVGRTVLAIATVRVE
jgi:hypothetical protein